MTGRGPHAGIAALCGAALLVGCSTPVVPPQVPEEEVEEQVEVVGTRALDRLIAARIRMIDVEYRLTRSAAPFCGKWNRPHPGVLVAGKGGFEEENIEGVASRALDLQDEITIVHVVPGGPFQRAGLRAGDRLVSIAGGRLGDTNELTQRFLELHEAKAVRVRFQRDGLGERVASVPIDLACPVRFGHATSALIVPWQLERVIITIPAGLLSRAATDDTLAVAMAHQLGHALFDEPSDDPLKAETRADEIGLRIAAGAGFDVRAAVPYWEDVAAEYPSLIGPAGPDWRPLAWEQPDAGSYEHLPHADIGRRLPQIRAQAEQIASEGSTSGGDSGN